MKLVNCKVGTKVVVKGSQKASPALRFWSSSLDQVCTIVSLPDSDGDVRIRRTDGSTDIGHHTNIRKYKGDTA